MGETIFPEHFRDLGQRSVVLDEQVMRPLHSVVADRSLLGVKTVKLDGQNGELKGEELRTYFHDTFTLYEKLLGVLRDPIAFYVKHEPLRLPLIFYVGHTSSFYVNKLVLENSYQDLVVMIRRLRFKPPWAWTR